MTKLYVELLRAFDEIGEKTDNEELRQTVQGKLREVSCCFTGHRPEKCMRTEEEIKAELEVSVRKAIADGYQVFINGAQRGVDIWAAEVVMKLVAEGEEIGLVTAIPFENFEKSLTAEWGARLGTVIEQSDDVQYVSSAKGKHAFMLRDRWMVDHSRRVIAVFNGTPGGTASTIEYANKQGREVEILPG